jgi:hypothetical protein
MTGFKEEFWEFKYYNMLIQVKTLAGLKRLGELCELNGYNKKILRQTSSSYVAGNAAMMNRVHVMNYPVIHFTSYTNKNNKTIPIIKWYSTESYESDRKNFEEYTFGVFEELDQLSDEAFQLWKELN